MEKIVSLSKRRGFVYPSSEIYGGIGSCWDYGPLGAELKRNVKSAWWQALVHRRDDVVGLDSSILQSPRVWEASGHVQNFTDPLVDCKECKARLRADHIDKLQCGNKAYPGRAASKCKDAGNFTEARQFNLMFKTFMGPVEDSAAQAYLRPETAQGIFINFMNVLNSARQKPPFGIAQIGKSFRNEITPGNFIFRTREFEQMEMEFFTPPEDWERWYAYWREQRFQWYVDLGMDPAKLRMRDHASDELAHYASACADVEYEFPFGWSELEGIAARGDFDLAQHEKHSGKDLKFFDEAAKRHYLPYVIEPAAGVDRATLAFMVDAYREEVVDGETRVVMRFHPRLAPTKVAVFPLVKKEGMPERAHAIADGLRKHFTVFYDESGAVGRRYRRQDEVGTPFCITVDGETATANTVTVRERDSMQQTRVNVDRVAALLLEKMA
ncbi:MAG: glycine--tRNA ligase [Planctomycetes bacterium]|nr:glycine--tRNA ligase [Planctomycetota bacterium]MCC7168831.1 glycine--tRNA ligase [Planctomycetota bacterium]